MGTTKTAIYKVDNGIDFDEIMFKTIATQVGLTSGETLQAWISKLQRTTYDNGDYILEKLPDGLILQASWHTILVSDKNVRTVTFQQAYPNKCIVIAVPLYKGNVEQIYVTNVTNTYFQAAAFNSSATNNSYFMWIAIGY